MQNTNSTESGDALQEFERIWFGGMDAAYEAARRREVKRRVKFERRDKAPWYRRHIRGH